MLKKMLQDIKQEERVNWILFVLAMFSPGIIAIIIMLSIVLFNFIK